jgi:glycosyltransferase involved in cell wall biosynthesis/GT2 family glycosyltransferase
MCWLASRDVIPVVALVSYSGLLGGAERVLLDFAAAIEGERVLACPPGDLADLATAAGIRVLPLRARPFEARGSVGARAAAAARLSAHGVELRRLMRDLDPDLIVACGMRSAMVVLLGRRVRNPVIFDHHDFLPSGVIAACVRAAARRADLVVVPSQAVAADLAVGERVEVINPGVEVRAFEARQPPSGAPEVLVLGALVPWKRPELAIEAVAIARRRIPRLRLRFAGAPFGEVGEELLATMRERCAALGIEDAVTFPGRLADVRAALADASCLLHCADAEPFGVALVEALAAARPVIAPDCAGPREILDDRCGVLYRPGDAVAAAQAIVGVLSDPPLAREMGVHGRERAARLFDRSNCLRRFSAAAGSVMRQGTAGDVALTIVTVTRNSAGVLAGLLGSIARWLPGAAVIVVDCASSDESVAIARAAGAKVIELDENVGFGRASNIGMLEARTPVTALLNPDVELLDDSLIDAAAEALSSERLIAPLVLRPDGSRQDTAHARPASAASVAGTVLPHRVPWLAPWRSRRPRRVGWAIGCAIVAPTEILRGLGPFDERLFMYAEDLDLCLRAAERGIDTWFWPRARVLHLGAHSSEREFGGEPFELIADARREVVRRQLGPGAALLDRAVQALTFAVRMIVKRALGRDAWRERERLRALR